MKNFGKTLFGCSSFIKWSLTPFVLLFAAVMPLLIEQWTPVRLALVLIMELMCAALLAGFWLPERFGRCFFRILCGAVFLAYAGYLISEFFFSDKPFKLLQSRGEASPRNALLGFIFIGLPSLCYSLFGRFTFRPPESENDEHEPESDNDSDSKN